MKCKKCGEQILNGELHCIKCGARLTTINWKIVALAATLAFVLLITAVTIFYIVPLIKYPFNRSEECIRTGNYTEAEQIYQKHFTDNSDQTMKLLGLVQDNIAKAEQDFSAGRLSFDEAVLEFNSIQVLSFTKEPALAAKKKLCSNYLERIKADFGSSAIAYAEAMGEVSKVEALGMLPADTLAQARATINQDYLMAIRAGFEKRTLNYETAMEMLGEVSGKEVDQQKEKVSIRLKALKASRDAFQSAKDYFSKNKLKEGLLKLKMVIDSDDEYVEAQSLYNEKLAELKVQVLSEAEGFARKKHYETSIIILNSALSTYFGNKEKDISDAIAKYTKLNNAKIAAENAKKKADAKKNQLVVVLSARAREGFILNYIEVVIKNNSKKTIKRYHVTWICYDANGKYQFCNSGYADRTVRPGKSFGRGYGWQTFGGMEDMRKVIACVTYVEYTDGTTWSNPYYDYWDKDYYNKPLR